MEIKVEKTGLFEWLYFNDQLLKYYLEIQIDLFLGGSLEIERRIREK